MGIAKTKLRAGDKSTAIDFRWRCLFLYGKVMFEKEKCYMHITVTDQDFEEKVVKGDKPILVDFWAVWCAPCRLQDPILEELDKEMGDKIVIAKMNVDENPNVPGKFGIMSIPTLMLFHKGQVVKQWIGVQGKETIKSEFTKLIE